MSQTSICVFSVISNGHSDLSVVFLGQLIPHPLAEQQLMPAGVTLRTCVAWYWTIIIPNFLLQSKCDKSKEDDIFSNEGTQHMQCYLLKLKRQMSTRKTGKHSLARTDWHLSNCKVWSELAAGLSWCTIIKDLWRPDQRRQDGGGISNHTGTVCN